MATSTSGKRRRNCRLLQSELHWRSVHLSRSNYFYDKYSTNISRKSLQFNLYPQIVSPHSNKITSLDIDNTSEGRFLLCGSRECTLSVYDLSLLGSDQHLGLGDMTSSSGSIRNSAFGDGGKYNFMRQELQQWKSKNRFQPIARSQVNFASENHLDPLYVPLGHSSSVTQVQWYPVDSGIFFSSDSAGNVLMWDANSFTPVSCVKKTVMDSSMIAASPCGIASIDLPKNISSHLLLAIGSIQTGGSRYGGTGSVTSRMQIDDRVVYLCDIKSGSMTHTLSGHGLGGIQVVQWSPSHDCILASGSRDGTIKLWDIRKSGSTACLVTLDRENMTQNEIYFSSIQGDIGEESSRQSRTRLKKKRKNKDVVGPGDYSKVETSSYIQSHAGPVSALSFTPCGNYIVSASTTDGLKLWDVQAGKGFGTLLPTRYLGQSASNQHPLDRMQKSVALRITQPGSFKSATVWVGGKNSKLLGYSIHGEGGRPDKMIAAHLDNITAIASQDNTMRLFTGSRDGMILGFGNRNEMEPDE